MNIKSPLVFQAEEDEQRIDRELKKQFPQLSNQVIKKWFGQKAIFVNGKNAPKGLRLQRGDQIRIADTTPLCSSHTHSIERCSVLYQDEEIIAVDKPSGIPSHPLHPWETNPIIDTVLENFPSIKNVGEQRAPGLLHRLDNETSGVLLFAKNEKTYKTMIKSRQSGLWKKYYLLWAHGKQIPSQTISTFIAHHPTNPRKMVSFLSNENEHDSPKHRGKAQLSKTTIFSIPPSLFKKEKSSIFEISEEQLHLFDQLNRIATPLCVSIDKGSRHQIRIQLASIGHPVVGDKLYGMRSEIDKNDKAVEKPLSDRLLLHSWRYILPLPRLDIQSKPTFPFPYAPEHINQIIALHK